jgi:hypothetical protein
MIVMLSRARRSVGMNPFVESMEQLVGDHGNFSQVTGKPAEIVLGPDQLTALSEAYDRERAKSSPWPRQPTGPLLWCIPRIFQGHHGAPIAKKLWKHHQTCSLKTGSNSPCTELDSLEVSESSNFKAIVSGEAIEARPIYGEPFTMRTTCKLWFLSNHLPRFRHGTEAELRRMRFIRFNRIPKVKDVTLKHRIRAERNGIFALMVHYLQRLMTLSEIPLGSAKSQESGNASQSRMIRLALSLRRCASLIGLQPRRRKILWTPMRISSPDTDYHKP